MNNKTDLEEQYDKIYRYCYFKLHRREAAEDITQEAFLRYLEHYGDCKQGWDLRYLYRIAHNLCVDEYRKPMIESLSGGNMEQEYVKSGTANRESVKTVSTMRNMMNLMAEQDHAEKTVTTLWLRDALNKLSEEEQEILLLRYANEVPNNLISQMLGVSRFALYRKIQHALRKLQTELGKEEY